MSSIALPDAGTAPEKRLGAFFSTIAECKDKNYATHGLHPYPAKFIPHIPREVIKAYSAYGDTVWDPMCGSGTTVVEAALAGRPAIGGDLNPIAVLVSRAKTTVLGASAHAELLALIAGLERAARRSESLRSELPNFHNRDHWFDSQVAQELAYGLQEICLLEEPTAEMLARCAFSAIIVPVSNQESETRWTARRQRVVAGQTLLRLAAKISDGIRRVFEFEELADADTRIVEEDARNSSVADESVNLVVTSPPYANSHDYYLYNKLRMFWLGYDVRAVQDAEIGSRNQHSDRGQGVDAYLDPMTDVLGEMHRALVSGGRAVIVVADAVIRNQLFSMDELLIERARAVGLDCDRKFSFDHRRFNAAFQRGFGTSKKKSTHVLVFQRP